MNSEVTHCYCPMQYGPLGGEALGQDTSEQILKTWTLVYSESGNGWEWRVQDQLEFLKLTMDRRKYEKCKEVLSKVRAFYQRLG